VRLGVNLIYDGAGPLARTAEQLDYAVAFAPEGHRSDAASVLGFVAAQTERIALCGGVMQIPARTPALAALTVATLDALSGGRARVGLGVSNPDVSEGWYGVPFAAPLARTREYVEILRQAFRGGPVQHQGEHFRQPSTPGGAPVQLQTQPLRPDIPIYLAAVGPRNLQLAGEVCDGWIGVMASPQQVKAAVDEIAVGRRRAGRTRDDFAVMPCVAASFADDPETAAEAVRPHFAFLLGMGSPERNLYCRLARELGFGDAGVTVNERMRAGDRAGAAEAVPFELVDQAALLGPVDRVARRMGDYAAAGVDVLGIMVSAVSTTPEGRLTILRDAARALDRSGVAG
jgi:F420-dependent oxidoreductase-like protein